MLTLLWELSLGLSPSAPWDPTDLATGTAQILGVHVLVSIGSILARHCDEKGICCPSSAVPQAAAGAGTAGCTHVVFQVGINHRW